MRASEILKQTGRSIAYRPALAKLFGGVTAEIFFEQIFYWQDKAENKELGVYKTQSELEEETGLTRKEQETARKKLREIGILIETHKRLEHRMYFKINMERLDEILSTLANVQTEHSPMPESDIREEPKCTFVNTLDYNTRLHTNNHLNPPEGREYVRDEFLVLLEGKINSNSAKQLHDKVEDILSANGFECKREFPVQDRGDGRSGRIDLVVSKSGVTIGLELDNETARGKSIFKLEQTYLDYKFVGLRNGIVGERSSVGDVRIFSVNHKTIEKIDYQGVIDAFNEANTENGSRLPFVRELSDKRKTSIKKFLLSLKEPTAECAGNYFNALFSMLRPFHFGEEKNSTWKANFDWAIRAETVIKVREENL
ncbi:hypothetical protein NMW45_07440 [Pasteurella multocida]|nr:hypothetical protein [Pasteurella multocida]MDH7438333.1 hypothetical protein [Pasteurella multocida]MDH7441037.1 hypothetical protein [Pasteurella multocida]MDY0427625.1 hypothetical protein [Pasteurella multocida]MDY0428839.1 hypothetical protein [Pasteurella multocida]MDY0495163.1 hypothetical protein [Pasteurella multocida]